MSAAASDGDAAPRPLPRMSQRPADAEDPDYGTLHRLAVHVLHTFTDLYIAFTVFGVYLFTFETLLLCVLSVGSVTFFTHWYSYHGALARGDADAVVLEVHAAVPRADERLSANINWTFFSFAVVFPLTFSLNEAFKRRELALTQLAQMKARRPRRVRAPCRDACAPQSNVLNIYMAHRDWNWATREDPSGGRRALPKARAPRAVGCAAADAGDPARRGTRTRCGRCCWRCCRRRATCCSRPTWAARVTC